MGDRKLGDLAIAFTIFIAVFSIFIGVIMSFDNATHNTDVLASKMISSSNLSNYGIGNFSYSDSTSKQLQSVTFNNNTFQAPEGQFIDTRGVSHGNVIANNYPSTITHFISGVGGLFSFPGSTVVWGMVIGIIIIIGIVLLLRSFQGTIKW